MKGKFRVLNTCKKTYILVPEYQAVYLESLLDTTYKGLDNSITKEIKRMTANKTVVDIEVKKWASKIGQIYNGVEDEGGNVIYTTADAINGELRKRRKKTADEFVKNVMGDVFGKVTYDKSGSVATNARGKNRRRNNKKDTHLKINLNPNLKRNDDENEDENDDEIPDIEFTSPAPAPEPVPAPVPLQLEDDGSMQLTPMSLDDDGDDDSDDEMVSNKPINRDAIADQMFDSATSTEVLEGTSSAFANFVNAIEAPPTVQDYKRKSKFQVIIDWGKFYGSILFYIAMLGVCETIYEIERKATTTINIGKPIEYVDIFSYNYFPDVSRYYDDAKNFVEWRGGVMDNEKRLNEYLDDVNERLEIERVAKQIWYSDGEEFIETIAKSQTPTEKLKSVAERLWASGDEDYVFDEMKKLDTEQKKAVALTNTTFDEMMLRFLNPNNKLYIETDNPMETYKNSVVLMLNNQYSDYTNFIKDSGKYSGKYNLDTRQTDNSGNRPVLLNWARLTRVYDNNVFSLLGDFTNIIRMINKYSNMGISKYMKLMKTPFAVKILGEFYDNNNLEETKEFRREMYKSFGMFVIFLTPTFTTLVNGGYQFLKLVNLKSQRKKFAKNMGENLRKTFMRTCDLLVMGNMVVTSYSALALLKSVDDDNIVNNFGVALGRSDLTTYYAISSAQLLFSTMLREMTTPWHSGMYVFSDSLLSLGILFALTIKDEPNESVIDYGMVLQTSVPFLVTSSAVARMFTSIIRFGRLTMRGYRGTYIQN